MLVINLGFLMPIIWSRDWRPYFPKFPLPKTFPSSQLRDQRTCTWSSVHTKYIYGLIGQKWTLNLSQTQKDILNCMFSSDWLLLSSLGSLLTMIAATPCLNQFGWRLWGKPKSKIRSIRRKLTLATALLSPWSKYTRRNERIEPGTRRANNFDF